ncbi:hypothetical protein CU098_000564, partial [Rhizopus stolonifer]
GEANEEAIKRLYDIVRVEKKREEFGDALFVDSDDITSFSQGRSTNSHDTIDLQQTVDTINLAVFTYLLSTFNEIKTCINAFFCFVEPFVKKHTTESLELYHLLRCNVFYQRLDSLVESGDTFDYNQVVEESFPDNPTKYYLIPDHSDNKRIMAELRSNREQILKENTDSILESDYGNPDVLQQKLYTYVNARWQDIKATQQNLNKKPESESESEMEEEQVEEPIVLDEDLEDQRIRNDSINSVVADMRKQSIASLSPEPYVPSPSPEAYAPSQSSQLPELPHSSQTSEVPKAQPHEEHQSSPIPQAQEEPPVPQAQEEPPVPQAQQRRRQLPQVIRRRRSSTEFDQTNLPPDMYIPDSGGPPRKFPKVRKKSEPWTDEETKELEQGLIRLKAKLWVQIRKKSQLLQHRELTALKDKARNEIKRRKRLGIDLGGFVYAEAD